VCQIQEIFLQFNMDLAKFAKFLTQHFLSFLDIPEFGHLGAASVFLPPHFARPNQNLLNRRKNRPVDPVKGEHEAITLNAFRLANR